MKLQTYQTVSVETARDKPTGSGAMELVHQLPDEPMDGLYVHVPFCFHKCHYCDFYSITRQTPQRMQLFVDTLLAEADLWTQKKWKPKTIFFGGGTPSLLPIDQMLRLIEGLKQRLDLTDVDEFTIEVNPATADVAYLRALRAIGVDRLSLGAQSFDPKDLAALERHHQPQDVPDALAMAREAGFARLNIDLIYAVPGQSMQTWEKNLDVALGLGLDHLSCYGLTYESNTPLGVLKRMGRLAATPEELELDMMRLTRKKLHEAGIMAYEISNYAKPGQACRHNLNYWAGGNYLGLGPSAASHMGGVRWKNKGHLSQWEEGVAARDIPVSEFETLSPRHRAAELAYLMLRTAAGIHLDSFKTKTGYDLEKDFAAAVKMLTYSKTAELSDGFFRLTEQGLAQADAAGGEFLKLLD